MCAIQSNSWGEDEGDAPTPEAVDVADRPSFLVYSLCLGPCAKMSQN